MEIKIEKDTIFGTKIKIKVNYEYTIIFTFFDGVFNSVRFHSIYHEGSKTWKPANKYEFFDLATHYLGDSEKAKLVHEELIKVIKKIRS